MADYPVKPMRGLWRTPNETASPPGSCRTLDNCCIRKDGVIEPLPDWANTAANGAPGIPLKMFDVPGDDLLVIYDSGGTQKTSWIDKDDGTETAITLNSADPTYENGAAHLVRFRDRYYLTSKQGLLCFDSAGDATARMAGFVAPPFWIQNAGSTTDAQAIPANYEAAYVAVFERELGDGSIIVGPPSTPRGVYAGAFTINPRLRIGWDVPSAGVIAGDYVSLYRTDAVIASIPWAGGETYRLVKRVPLSSTDITNEYVEIWDAVPQANLGSELYTNPGQSGLVKAHFPPPYMRDIVLYKGCVIGIAYKESYAVTLRVSGTFGDTDTTVPERVTGVGLRVITGDTSVGTNTILNVSADHMKGIAVGQEVVDGDFPAGSQVTAASGTTITVDNNATATTVGNYLAIYDLLELGGVEYRIESSLSELLDGTAHGDDTGIARRVSTPVRSYVQGVSLSFFAERASYAGTTFGVRGTNGSNYSPSIPALSETAKAADDATQGNRLAWSEPDEPEHWPLVNRDTIGQGEILRLIVAGDICYIFNDQGEVYAMTGEPDAWRYDLIAEDVQLATVGSVAAHEGRVYAWTNQGLVVFSGGSIVANLSHPRITDDLKIAYRDCIVEDAESRFTWRGEVVVDQFHREVWLITGYEETLGYDEGQPWLYNLQTDEWYRYAANYKAPVYVDDRARIYVGRQPSEAWMISYAEDHDAEGDKINTCTAEFNRLDLGAPGVLKKWREVVFHFRPRATGSETIAFFTNADKEAGGATSSVNYTPTFDATDSVNLPCHVARNTGMSVTQRIKLSRATAATSWELEGFTVRYEPLVDRTGARAA